MKNCISCKHYEKGMCCNPSFKERLRIPVPETPKDCYEPREADNDQGDSNRQKES
jgi:hypothetical protein